MTPVVSIIIVSWNVKDLLRQNLSQLFALRDEVPTEVIVVDNASQDGSARMVREAFPWVTWIQNDWNAGFSAAVNEGLQVARGRVVLLLNPDMCVRAGALRRVVDILDARPDIGVVGARLLAPDGTLVPSVRRDPTRWDQWAILLKLPHLALARRALDRYHATDMDYAVSQAVEQVRGSFVAFRASLTQAIGEYDERFFLWFEDVDFCKRVREAGWLVWYAADVAVQDAVGRSFAQVPVRRKQWMYARSLVSYGRKWGTWVDVLGTMVLVPFAVASGVGVDVARWIKRRVLKRGV